MQRQPPLVPPPPTDSQRPSAKGKRAWGKPTVRQMSYVNATETGTNRQNTPVERHTYIPQS